MKLQIQSFRIGTVPYQKVYTVLPSSDPSSVNSPILPILLYMKTLGIVIVGSRYGARMHYANFQKLPHGLVEIRGVCSQTMESAESFAR